MSYKLQIAKLHISIMLLSLLQSYSLSSHPLCSFQSELFNSTDMMIPLFLLKAFYGFPFLLACNPNFLNPFHLSLESLIQLHALLYSMLFFQIFQCAPLLHLTALNMWYSLPEILMLLSFSNFSSQLQPRHHCHQNADNNPLDKKGLPF